MKKRKLNRFSWRPILFFHLPSSFTPADIDNVINSKEKLPNPNDYLSINFIGKDCIDIIINTNFFKNPNREIEAQQVRQE